MKVNNYKKVNKEKSKKIIKNLKLKILKVVALRGEMNEECEKN